MIELSFYVTLFLRSDLYGSKVTCKHCQVTQGTGVLCFVCCMYGGSVHEYKSTIL